MSQENSTIGENIEIYRNKLEISQYVLSKKFNLAFHLSLKLKPERH